MKQRTILITFALAACLAAPANAALHGRLPATTGGIDYQAYYDDVLDITWAQDAGLSGVNDWVGSQGFAAGLEIGGITGWRVASMDVDGDGVVFDCRSPIVTDEECRDNEYSYMFDRNGINFPMGTGPFAIPSSSYWSSTDSPVDPENLACSFAFDTGNQGCSAPKSAEVPAWAVYPGDVDAGAGDPPGAENGIVGSWYNISDPDPVAVLAGGPVILNLLDNGQYQLGTDGDTVADPNGMDGMEWGTYTFDGATLAFTGLLDTNGGWGLSSASLPVALDGNTLTVDTGDGDFVFNRISSDSLVGGWLAVGPENDESVSITFLDDGTFMLIHGNNPGNTCGCGQAGIEYGTYSWDEMTGAISFNVLTDTNGEFGVSHPVGGTWDSLVLTGDQFTLFDDGESFTFLRILAADDDDDGVINVEDNCVLAANPDQADGDTDGFGNACDADLNNDCQINFGDLAGLKAAFFPNPYDPAADFNADGFVNFSDLALLKSLFNSPPGPSGVPNVCNTPFTGAVLNNLEFWLDAADTDTLSSVGGNVLSWADKSPLRGVVAALGEDQRPLDNVTLQNGLTTLSFDGNDDVLCARAPSDLSGELSVFVVGSNAVRKDYNGVLSLRDSTAENALLELYWQVGVSDATSGNLVYAVNRDANLAGLQFEDAPPAITSPYLVSVHIGPDSSTELRVNRQLQGPTVVQPADQLPSAAAPLCLGIGFGDTTVGNVLNGTIAEVIVFDRRLDADEVEDIEAYLDTKWAIVPN